ncbi:hypothetical protein [Variovorax sp. RA8]|uniref:hypothetical protein n=1 Tax=Variovorax sp. (strain JCM 16519 / RA8) TaxID=662548 RepID=UPI000A972F17|nr:hypothetical protein [Variovorax sp. RA8]VTU34572.1 hypothetical protein RA8CHR_05000 [Variovorax sp. RA8]
MNELTQEQKERVQQLIQGTNNAFQWLNMYVEEMNITRDNFYENCQANIQLGEKVMEVAGLISLANKEILKITTGDEK